MTSKEKLFSCELCGKIYHLKKSLRSHYLIHHPASLLHLNLKSVEGKKFACDLCCERFSYRSCLVRHKRSKHPEHAPRKVKKIKNLTRKCPLCDSDMPKSSIIEHFKVQHEVEIVTERLEFASHTEFLAWKECTESRTCTRFVKEQGDVTKRDQLISSYICHRSGIFESAGQQKRQMKLQGSCKINAFCPASIKMIKSDGGKCQVEYLNTHVGHDFDLRHVCLSGRERQEIAARIASEASFDEILDDVRDSLDVDNIKRFHLVTRKDLHNIKKSFDQRLDAQHLIDEPEPDWVLRNKVNSSRLYLTSSVALNQSAPTAEKSQSDRGPTEGTTSSEAKPEDISPREKELLAENEKLLESIQTLDDKYKRALAENENVRIRMRREISDTKQYGIQSFVKDLIEVADVLARATESVPKDALDTNIHLKSLFEGLQMTEAQLQSVFRRYGVTQINPIGEKFDPNHHEALFEQEDSSKEPGAVGTVTKVGYKLHERVVRPAMVGVVKAIK